MEARDVVTQVRSYIQTVEDGRQLSPNTVAAYRRDLIDLVAFLDRHYQHDDWTWTVVDRGALRAYGAHLTRRQLARRSIARKLSSVRSFFRWMQREDVLEANPARSIRSPKLERTLPGWLTRAEADRLFALRREPVRRRHVSWYPRPRHPRDFLRVGHAALGATAARRRRC